MISTDADGDSDNVGWLSSNGTNDGFVVLLDVDQDGIPTLTGSVKLTEVTLSQNILMDMAPLRAREMPAQMQSMIY